MSFYDKHKLHNYFVKAAPSLKDIIGIQFLDKEKGRAACITWGNIYKEDELLELIKVQGAQYGFNNIEFIEYCYSLQEIAGHSYFYERWIYFVQQIIPYENGYKIWVKEKKQAIFNGQDIKFLGGFKK